MSSQWEAMASHDKFRLGAIARNRLKDAIHRKNEQSDTGRSILTPTRKN
jgi:hypothetical protein